MSLEFDHINIKISTTNTAKPITLNDTSGVKIPIVSDDLLTTTDGLIALKSTATGSIPANKLRVSNNGVASTLNDNIDIENLRNYSNKLVQEKFDAIDDRIDDLEAKSGVPLGLIAVWSTRTAPAGWAICDGGTYNGIKTPDLRDRFVLGASSTSTSGRHIVQPSGKMRINDYGGESSVKLTEKTIPSHRHIASWGETSTIYRPPWGLWPYNVNRLYGSAGSIDYNNVWRYTSPAGGDEPHNNLSPFQALVYIMYVG